MEKLINKLKESIQGKKSLADKHTEIKNGNPNMTYKEICDSVDAYVNYW